MKSKEILAIAALFGLYELSKQLPEFRARHWYWGIAQEYCKKVGKPLLRIGIRRSPLEPPNGDVTLDIDPIVLDIPGGVLGDERAMWMFRSKQFGVTFNEHTLEHLHTPHDVQLAVNESARVANWAIFLVPSPSSIIARLHPTHQLTVRPIAGGLVVCDNAHGDRCRQIILPANALAVTSI